MNGKMDREVSQFGLIIMKFNGKILVKSKSQGLTKADAILATQFWLNKYKDGFNKDIGTIDVEPK